MGCYCARYSTAVKTTDKDNVVESTWYVPGSERSQQKQWIGLSQRRNRNTAIAGSGGAGGEGNQCKVHVGGRTDRTFRGQPQNTKFFNFADF